MRYLALACDYDGTLATDGVVAPPTLAALERVQASGRRLLLVTGRELEELLSIFPFATRFDRIVAENGALLYAPGTREERRLGEAPPPAFVDELRRRGVAPLSVGRSIVATFRPHETTVFEVIRDLGLELQVIFNKDAVMVLPSGVNKGTGLRAALDDLGLSAHNTIGVGDAENDHAFLRECELAVAVANALPTLKERADLVTAGARGEGVAELAHALVEEDVAAMSQRLGRHDLLLGHALAGDRAEVRLPAYGPGVLVAGPSGAGKSTLVTGLLERMGDAGYQVCLVDPEGDHETLAGAVTAGTSTAAPEVAELLRLLEAPGAAVVANLVAVALPDRPAFFAELLGRLVELRARTGRPHWIVVDEAHHVLPAGRESPPLASRPGQMVFITIHPDRLSPGALSAVGLVLAVGEDPGATLALYARSARLPPPVSAPAHLERGQAAAWRPDTTSPPIAFALEPARAEHRRHRRKYAAGDLGPDESFVFRGPEDKLRLRAQNLLVFLQMAEGVDDATWLHHLTRGDYADWFRTKIKDPELADLAAQIAAEEREAAGSRARIKRAIEERYTLPA